MIKKSPVRLLRQTGIHSIRAPLSSQLDRGSHVDWLTGISHSCLVQSRERIIAASPPRGISESGWKWSQPVSGDRWSRQGDHSFLWPATFADDCSIGREGSPTLAASFNYWMKMMTDCCCLDATFDAILDFQESPGEEPLPAKTVRPEGGDNRHGSDSPPPSSFFMIIRLVTYSPVLLPKDADDAGYPALRLV